MTTNLMDMLKLVESTLHKMENHIELESFDRQVMKLWIEIHSSKEEIVDDDHLRGKYELVREQIARILQDQFNFALGRIEQADDETAFSRAKDDATEWQGMFSNVDQNTVNSSPRLETSINRYRLFAECFKKYTVLTRRLIEELDSHNISGLRTDISGFLENLNKAILTLQSDLRLDQQEHDRRIDLFRQWIGAIENNETVQRIFDVSKTMTIQVSGDYAAGMDDLKNKDPDLTVYHYISDDPIDPVMGWNKVRDVIVIWDRRWKRYCSKKIQQYADELLNSGLDEKGPFAVDPFEWKMRFDNLVEHIKRPITDLDRQTRDEYQAINHRISQAIFNFRPLRDRFEGVRELINTDDQRDPLDLLVELDRVWLEIRKQVPLYATANDDLRGSLIPRVKNQLRQRYSGYRKLFLSNPFAVKRAAHDVVSKLKQFTEFEADRFDIERLINLCELFESEMNAASGELPDRALARLEALQVTIENEKMGDIPLMLTMEIQTRRAGLKPVKVGQELKVRATDLLRSLENQATSLPIDQLVTMYLNQIESVLKQMEVALPELRKQPSTNTALLPIFDSLVNSQRTLMAWSAYLQAAVEIERPGADLKQINNWLDVVRSSVYRKNLFTKFDDIVNKLAGFGANDGMVEAIVTQINTALEKTGDDYQCLTGGAISGLLNLWAQLDAVRDLSTTRISERRAARAALEQKILRIAMNLLALLHEEVTKVSLKDLELTVQWMQKNQATHPYLIEMEAHLSALQALSYLKPDHGEPNLDAAITAWKRARERSHPHAEAMQRALKKMKALVDAAKGVFISLASANADPTLKYDTDVIACTLQSKLLKIIKEYENIEYLSGKVITVAIVGEARVVPFPLIEDFRTDYGNITYREGEMSSPALDLEYQVMWDQYHLTDVMKSMQVLMPPAPALIYDEFLFRSQTYKNLASLIFRMAQSQTLVELQRVCSHDALPLVNNVGLKTRHAELLKRIPKLDDLATNLWTQGRSAYEQELVAPAGGLADPHKNDYRRMILNPDSIYPLDGSINRIHELQIWLANSITHFQNKRTTFVSATYVIGLGPDSIGKHHNDLSSIAEQAKDLHAIFPHFLTLYFARLQLDDTAWKTHPLGTIFIDLTNFIQDRDLDTFLAHLKDLHKLYQNVREKQASGLLLALDNEADDELGILTSQITVIKLWATPAGYADLAGHPSFIEIERQVRACDQKRKIVLKLLKQLKEAGNVAGVPGGTVPTDMEKEDFIASRFKDPLAWASDLLQRLEEEAPDPLKTPLWRWSLIFGNMTEEAVIKKYITAESTLVAEAKTYLDKLNARVNKQVGGGTEDLLIRTQNKISTDRTGICAWLLQAKYKEAFDEWVSQVGLEFDLKDEQLPVNGGGVERARQVGVCTAPLVTWLVSLRNWFDIQVAVKGIDSASQKVPYKPMDGVWIKRKNPGGRGMYALFADMVQREAEFHKSLGDIQTASAYRISLIQQEQGIFTTLPLWTEQVAGELALIASLYSDYEDALEKAWTAWRAKSAIRVPWLDFRNQNKRRFDEAKEDLQSKACSVCRLAPDNSPLREQLGLECSRFTDPKIDNPCGRFTLDGRL
ncbi:hypothetical protein LARV_00927 [Longilinea arvoryzae]|uniref:Uncharacterized protein n=1 Tax=Longilinea arvoryzae TaxID=360412 RepID=A0A0S7BGB4_9CHLR|nr:hypothetical protein [Longilinea arvoryzae]GAP13176.1 hypothetical protein LARV_00927 [Longilinea arvoryzae]